MSNEEYDEQLEEEQAFLAYESNYRRMYEEGLRAGRIEGRAEMMLRIYEQEPLGPRVEVDESIPCPF